MVSCDLLGPSVPLSPPHMQSDGSRRSGRGRRTLSPPEKQTKRSKLAGAEDDVKTGVGKKKRRKEENKKRKEKMTHPGSGTPLLLPRRLLGWQRVVVAFAALALAAKNNGRGQEEEGGGDQQQEAEAGEYPHHLETDGRSHFSPEERVSNAASIQSGSNDQVRSVLMCIKKPKKDGIISKRHQITNETSNHWPR